MREFEISRRQFCVGSVGVLASASLPFGLYPKIPHDFASDFRSIHSDIALANSGMNPPSFVHELKNGNRKSPVPNLSPVVKKMSQARSYRRKSQLESGTTTALRNAKRAYSELQNKYESLYEKYSEVNEEVRNLSSDIEKLQATITYLLEKMTTSTDFLGEQHSDRQWENCDTYNNSFFTLIPKWTPNLVDFNIKVLAPHTETYCVLPGPSAWGLRCLFDILMDTEGITYGECASMLYPVEDLKVPSGNFQHSYRRGHVWRTSSNAEVVINWSTKIDDGGRNVVGYLTFTMYQGQAVVVKPTTISVDTWGLRETQKDT